MAGVFGGFQYMVLYSRSLRTYTISEFPRTIIYRYTSRTNITTYMLPAASGVLTY